MKIISSRHCAMEHLERLISNNNLWDIINDTLFLTEMQNIIYRSVENNL